MSGVVEEVIPEGYKQTEVGLIPEDWKLNSLGELVLSVEYGSSAKSKVTGAIPVLRMGNLQLGKVDWNNLVYTDDFEEISKYKLKYNDVLFNRTNTIDLVGKTSIYKGEYPAVFAGYLIRINRIKSQLDADYLNYTLNSYHSKKYSRLILSVAVSQANINGQKLKTYPVPTPPTLKEQTAIANALSDVDALITSLEKLIAKKRAIKTAAMQQLLTGKKRLPPFDTLNSKEGKPAYKQTELGEIPVDWEVLSLRDISLDMLQGVNTAIDIPDYVEDGIPMLKANNVIDQVVKFKNVDCISLKTYSGYNDRYKLKRNDFLFSNIGARLGTGSLLNAEIECSFAWNVMRIIPDQNKIEARLLAFQINSPKYSEKIKSEQSGSGMGFIPKSTMQKVKLAVPSDLNEQTGIANVLSDMDKETETLETRLNKTQQLKQGMMQELLTGKTRLI